MSKIDDYPPEAFCQKFADILAPNGKLMDPANLFTRVWDESMKERVCKGFQITFKKLHYLKHRCVNCGQAEGKVRHTMMDTPRDFAKQKKISLVRMHFFAEL